MSAAVDTPPVTGIRQATYAEAHTIYRAAGWTGPLPLPAGTKWPPPDGFTGWHGTYPSGADSQTWIDDYPEYANTYQLALRMPDDIIGIDVDHYGDKRGGDTLAEAARRWGPLPAAPRSSARTEPLSGIRFYRVPPGTTLRTKIGFPELELGGIEIIQKHHRYAVVWPSIHPTTGTPYAWHDTSGPDVPPRARHLLALPDRWIEALRSTGEPGEAAADPVTVAAFSRDHATGDQLGAIRGVLAVFQRDAAHGTRHDAMVTAACMAAREARAGRYPASEARSALREAFTLALAEARPGQRLAGPAEARREFESIWAWAVGQALAEDPDALRARLAPRQVHTEVAHLRPVGTGGRLLRARSADEFFGDEDEATASGEMARQVIDAEIVDDDLASSWTPVDLEELWDDAGEPRQSDYLHREDGVAMFYAGKTHSVHGESESGKSWIGQSAALERVMAGERVLYVDYEDDARSVLMRMRFLGMRREHLPLFVYVSPEGPQDYAFAELLTRPYALAVIDGVTVAMSHAAKKSNDQDEYTAWYKSLPLRIARHTGAAVVQIDHVSKSKDERGRFAIGSQAKMGNISGSAFYVDVHQGFGQGKVGELRIYVGKDRPGGVRAHAGKMRRDRLQPFARYIHDAADPTAIAVTLAPWLDEDDETSADGARALPRGRDWNDPEQPLLPADIRHFSGTGQSAVGPLARFMRAMAVGGDGMSRLDAVTALRADVGVNGKPKNDDLTVKRAWGALREAGRLKPAESNVSENPNGLHWWVPREGDPAL